MTKVTVAFHSAFRSAWPIILNLLILVQAGVIQLKDIWSTSGIISIILAMAGKGVASGISAKSVEIKPKLSIKL